MKRLLDTGLVVFALVLNAAIPALAGGTQRATNPAVPVKAPTESTVTSDKIQAVRVVPAPVPQPTLSERDRLVLERQTQRLIPPQ